MHPYLLLSKQTKWRGGKFRYTGPGYSDLAICCDINLETVASRLSCYIFAGGTGTIGKILLVLWDRIN